MYHRGMTQATPSELSDVISIASGGDFALAVTSRGAVFSWGADHFGVADAPADLLDVRSVAAGQVHSLALKNDGTVVTWGLDADKQLAVPEGLCGVIAVKAGGMTSAAILGDGSAVYWGNLAGGEPRHISAPGLSVVDLAVGDTQISFLLSSGEVEGKSFRLDARYEPVSAPQPLPFLTAVSAGSGFIIGLTRERTVIAWGRNDYGQCEPPADLSDVVAISAGGGTPLALHKDGTIVTWGENSVPADLSAAKAIAAGKTSAALLIDGTVVSWTDNG